MASGNEIIGLVQEATRKLASNGSFDSLLKDVLSICVHAGDALGGTIYIHDASSKRLRFQHVLPADVEDKLPTKDMADDFGLAGAAFQSRSTLIRDFPDRPESDWNEFERCTGVPLRSMVAVPLMIEGEEPVGVVQLINKREGVFNDMDQIVLDIIAAVCTMGYLNARLTEESSRASTLLGMGKVSHDIGNLAASLYATLSYADMPLDGLRETVADAHKPNSILYLDNLQQMHGDLKRSVDRIVGYSRLISDLSAGKSLRPVFEPGQMAQTIETAAAYLESEGRKNGVQIDYDLQADAPVTCYDDLFVFRIVQNLVGNAIKAVRESTSDAMLKAGKHPFGTVLVRYRFEGEKHILEVCDTGAGMSQSTVEKILSGNARSMWEKGGGSGWGTKIVKELAASHQAKLSIESQLGHGSTFRVVFPHADTSAQLLASSH